MADAESQVPDARSIMVNKQYAVLLVLVAVVGVVVSLAAWGFLEGVYLAQQGIYDDLPDALGFNHTPLWWPLPVLAIAGVITAFAIARLPGNGGHLPSDGLNASPAMPIDVPGVILAGFAGIGLGIVLGPEAPLMALGSGLGFLAVRSLRKDAPPELGQLVASSGVFAGLSFLFGSPIIAAVILIEAAGLGGRKLPLVLIPGLMAAGIGSLVSIGMGDWTGVDTSAISLELLPVPEFDRPTLVDILWAIPLAAAVAIGTFLIFRIGKLTAPRAAARPFLVLPVVGVVVAGLAIAFTETTDKGLDQVLFSGQEAIGPLIEKADTWSVSALALLLLFKGLAYAISLGSFRGGPVFPAMFLGAAAGLMASHLPGLDLTPAVAVGMGAAVVAILRLPLAAVVLATLLTSAGGVGAGPVVIIGVVVAYIVTLALPGEGPETTPSDGEAASEPGASPTGSGTPAPA